MRLSPGLNPRQTDLQSFHEGFFYLSFLKTIISNPANLLLKNTLIPIPQMNNIFMYYEIRRNYTSRFY